MYHTIAWRESIADIVEADIDPVADTLMLVQNSHFVPQFDQQLLWAYYGAAGATRARFVAPSFRQVTTPWIRPINIGIVPLDDPNVADYRANPLRLKALEEFQLSGSQTTGGAAVVVGIAGISKGGIVPAPMGDVYTLRGTAATTLVAGAWTGLTMTWQDTLPAGLYACIGASAFGATLLAVRFIFEDQWERPGVLGSSLLTSAGHPMFMKGGLGVLGRFNANRFPNVEALANAADTAQEIYMDFVRIG